jgi:hypothetical protein
MRNSTLIRLSFFVCAVICALPRLSFSQDRVDDFDLSLVAGREYFILRSGDAKLILQSDKAGLQPAFTFMLFDADKPCQTLRKERAFNYTPEKACSSSALEVVLGGIPFTSLGLNTEVHWRNYDGIPAVEATWWAGGIRVQESFSALDGAGAFLRKIVLSGKDIVGPDSVRLRLSLPPGRYSSQHSTLLGIIRNISMGIALLGDTPVTIDDQNGSLETGPLTITPGAEVTVETLLLTRIPAPGYFYSADCEYDRTIDPRFLLVDKQSNSTHGLKAEYFNNPDLRANPAVVRIDTNTSPSGSPDFPAAGVRRDSFSVRYTGELSPPSTGTYKLSLIAHDRARLFIDGKLVIDCWEHSSLVRKTADVEFEPGRLYDIRLEYAALTGYARLRFRWTLPVSIVDDKKVEEGIKEVFESVAELSRTHAVDAINRTKDRWRNVNSMKTGDSLMQTLFSNVSYALPGMVSENGRMDAGIFEYGNQWVRDGSNVALGLLHAGHFEAARAILNHILSDLVSSEGATAVYGGFDKPDYEEFDQMGELVHVLKAYHDWTGDSSLITNYRTKIIAMVERPLNPAFRDSTGMVHNRREYWERSFDDAYELAYQTFMIQGLRDAADLSGLLGVPEKAAYWRTQADVFLNGMLHNPTKSLVENGALIKRRNVDGSVADYIPGIPYDPVRDDPRSTEAFHKLNPDASYALPILLHIIDPKSDLSLCTLDKLESLWNARWSFGGYERYQSSSQQDQPGPWCFATAFIARAQQDAALYDRSRRALQWLLDIQGGNSGAWFEEIPLIRSQVPSAGIVPWASAEIATFTVRDWLGVRFDDNDLIIRPNLFPQDKGVTAELRFRSSRLTLEIDKSGEVSYALVDGKKFLPRRDGAIAVPADMLAGGGEIKVFAK